MTMSNNKTKQQHDGANIPTATEDEKISVMEENPFDLNENTLTRILIEAARIAIIGPSIAAMLAPFDVLMHSLHIKTNFSQQMGRGSLPIFALSALKAILAGFPSSAKASTIKNGVYNQRHGFEEKLESTEISEIKDKEKLEKTPLNLVIQVSILLGWIEASFTQYLSNTKTWKHQEELTAKSEKPFKAPVAKTYCDTFKMFHVGYPVRSAKSMLTVLGYGIGPTINDALQPILPENATVNHVKITAPMITGFIVGAVGNVFEIIYKNQVIQTCSVKIKSPYAHEVLRDLVAKEGVQTLRRGLFSSVGYLTFTYIAVPKVEKFADRVLVESGNLLSQAKHSSFFMRMSAQLKRSIQVSKENKETTFDDYTRHSFGQFV